MATEFKLNYTAIISPYIEIDSEYRLICLEDEVEIIFEKFPLVAYWAIIGLIIASPFAIFIASGGEGFSVIALITGVIALAVGAVIGNKLGGDETPEKTTEQ